MSAIVNWAYGSWPKARASFGSYCAGMLILSAVICADQGRWLVSAGYFCVGFGFAMIGANGLRNLTEIRS